MINLEVFSCSGGMAEGFRRAGIVFDVVVDRDPNACASYEANLKHRPIQMDVRDLLRLARIGAFAPAVRLFVADPPCTPWSLAGKRQGLSDERDMLTDTCELVRLLRPRSWLIANVPGLDTVPNWPIVQRTIGALSDLGYVIDYASLDAAAFGVAQHRRRPFWFGALEGRIVWPAPTHHDPGAGACLFGRRPWVTCREALAHVPAEALGRRVRLAWKPAKHHRPSDPNGCARTLTTNPNTDGALLGVRKLSLHPNRHGQPPSQIDVPAGTLTMREGRGANLLEVESWPWDRPATTVQADERLEPPGHHEHVRSRDAIVLSERAAAILQGFPDGWSFVGKTKRARWSQIGQAMPPPLAEHVARAIRDVLAAQPPEPRR